MMVVRKIGYLASLMDTAPGVPALVIIPSATLGGYWGFGEPGLIVGAIAMPALYASTKVFRGRFGRIWRDRIVTRSAELQQRERLELELDDAMASYANGEINAACFAVELDGFDAFKRKHGVRDGHDVFQAMWDRLSNVFRRSDIIARISSSGFGISIKTIRRFDTDSAQRIADRIKNALEIPIEGEEKTHNFTCTVGFCLASHAPTETGKGILDGAAHAASEAAAAGPGNVRSYTKAMGGVFVRPELTDDVDAGFENKEILPYFQPQVCTTTGQITGLEALARWHHPKQGLVPPLEFLNAVAMADRWIDLTDTMLDKSLACLRDLDELGIDVPQVGVNFAQADLEHPQLVDRIRWALDKYNLQPHRLSIEILESVVADSETDTVSKTVDQLAGMGCTIDLDDFGTGHASISSLRQFKITRIKIDRSFVIKVDADPDQQEMMATILLMAKQLKMETLAEGVETQAEMKMLEQMGCEHLQGFGISKPLPLKDLRAWLMKRQLTSTEQTLVSKSA